MKKEGWHFADGTQWKGPITRDKLDELHAEGQIYDDTYVVNESFATKGPLSNGVPYSQLATIAVSFSNRRGVPL